MDPGWCPDLIFYLLTVTLFQEGVSNKYTSVFKGSIFEAGSGSQAPTVLLKLLYHWSCQTNIPNVASWVKVDNRQIDDFYSLLRSICTR